MQSLVHAGQGRALPTTDGHLPRKAIALLLLAVALEIPPAGPIGAGVLPERGGTAVSWPVARPMRQAATPVPASGPAPAPGAAGADHSPISYGSWGAGFVADAPSGSAFTAVSTRFVAPAAPGVGQTGWVAIWGGIGLAAPAGDQLMQSGVSMESAAGGTWQVTLPWWINEPEAPTIPHVMSVPVSPGDTVEVDVGQIDATDWGFRVTDQTTHATAYGSCAGCTSQADTAAWVVEDPTSSSGSGQTVYSAPSQVQFLSASAAVNGGALLPLDQLAWHPLLREAGGATDGPAGGGGPAPGGAFTVAQIG